MEKFRLFVSRSFDERDAGIFEGVARFCRAVGFEPIRTERVSQHLPTDKIREALDESHAFLGLLTRNHEGGDAETRPWIMTEIGMAQYAKLPVILFVEEGVAYPPGDHFASVGRFSRSDPDTLLADLVEALVELRENQRLKLGSETSSKDAPYRFIIDDIQMTIEPDGTLDYRRFLEIESNIVSLRALQPMRKTITSSTALGYRDNEFDLEVDRHGPEADFEVLHEDPHEVSLRVTFPDPLGKGDRARFTIHHRSRGSLPLVMEDLRHLVAQKDYISKELLSRQGHAVKVATDSLFIRLVFPRQYPLQDSEPRLAVTLRDRVGDSSRSEAERERVASRFVKRHDRLELEVDQPLTDCAYYFVWKPPAAADVPESMRLDLPVQE